MFKSHMWWTHINSEFQKDIDWAASKIPNAMPYLSKPLFQYFMLPFQCFQLFFSNFETRFRCLSVHSHNITFYYHYYYCYCYCYYYHYYYTRLTASFPGQPG